MMQVEPESCYVEIERWLRINRVSMSARLHRKRWRIEFHDREGIPIHHAYGDSLVSAINTAISSWRSIWN